MTSLNKKLIWSALAIAALITPALAQRQHHVKHLHDSATLFLNSQQYPSSGFGDSGSIQRGLEKDFQ